jgi:hypothetical protein
VLCERSRNIGNIVPKYWVQTCKFRIKITRSVPQALLSKIENGGTLWWDAICKEVKNENPAFDIWEKDISDLPPEGCQESTFRVTFDMKWAKA